MKHFHPFKPREVIRLPIAERNAWTLKRYAILAENRNFDEQIASAALDVAIEQLPPAGTLENADGNHGIAFQLVHFAEVAVVSPIFYWMWGSVLANTKQMRAQWDNPTEFEEGVTEVVGCLWELEVISFEVQSWMQIMLSGFEASAQKKQYLNLAFPKSISKLTS